MKLLERGSRIVRVNGRTLPAAYDSSLEMKFLYLAFMLRRAKKVRKEDAKVS